MTLQEIKDKITISEYCDLKGYDYYKDGHYKGNQSYKLKIHDSLVFTDDWFFWNSRNKKGDIIQFVIEIENTTFGNAKKILEELIPSATGNKKSSQRSSTPLTTSHEFIKNVIAYLSKTRNINYSIISDLIKNDYLTSDEHRNCVFKIKDYKTKETCGYERIGTLSDIRYKNFANVEYGVGFNLTIGNSPNQIIFCESVIDLLSYIEIRNPKNAILVSLGGLKANVFKNALEAFKGDFKVIMALDNDIAAKNFIESLKNDFKDITLYKDSPNLCKDWNEVLKTKNA